MRILEATLAELAIRASQKDFYSWVERSSIGWCVVIESIDGAKTWLRNIDDINEWLERHAKTTYQTSDNHSEAKNNTNELLSFLGGKLEKL